MLNLFDVYNQTLDKSINGKLAIYQNEIESMNFLHLEDIRKLESQDENQDRTLLDACIRTWAICWSCYFFNYYLIISSPEKIITSRNIFECYVELHTEIENYYKEYKSQLNSQITGNINDARRKYLNRLYQASCFIKSCHSIIGKLQQKPILTQYELLQWEILRLKSKNLEMEDTFKFLLTHLKENIQGNFLLITNQQTKKVSEELLDEKTTKYSENYEEKLENLAKEIDEYQSKTANRQKEINEAYETITKYYDFFHLLIFTAQNFN